MERICPHKVFFTKTIETILTIQFDFRTETNYAPISAGSLGSSSNGLRKKVPAFHADEELACQSDQVCIEIKLLKCFPVGKVDDVLR